MSKTCMKYNKKKFHCQAKNVGRKRTVLENCVKIGLKLENEIRKRVQLESKIGKWNLESCATNHYPMHRVAGGS